MRPIIRILLAATAALLAGAGPALAQFDQGVAALQSGDYAGAMQAWQAAIGDEDGRALYSIGYLTQFGLGVPADPVKAREWYQKAAEKNNADALYALGLLTETGKGGTKDLAEAMKYYRRAAAIGPHPDAEYAIGRMVLRGRGVPRDPIEGVVWLKTAADHGHPAAQYMLGAAYEAGWGVTPNPADAYYWYSRAKRNDPVELQEDDMSFQPQIALDALRRRLSADTVRRIEARVKKDEAKIEKEAKVEKKVAPAP